ncbi:hypothetical protein LTR53_012225 [Teratosphaeriaceae sp. CCFEE 6253]|nr:hypothetical protein LTR53_012225 [Teratosphaeriaceae sp. CCFEE 6253]
MNLLGTLGRLARAVLALLVAEPPTVVVPGVTTIPGAWPVVEIGPAGDSPPGTASESHETETPGAEIPAPPPPPPAAADSPPAQSTPPPPPPPPRHDAEKPPPGPPAKRVSFVAAYAMSARISGPARPIFGRLALESSAVPARAVMIPVLYRAGSVRIPRRAKRPVGLCSGEPDLRRKRRVFSAVVERDLCVRLEGFGRGVGCAGADRGRVGRRRALPAERAWVVSPLPVVEAESGSAPATARQEDDGAGMRAEEVVGADVPLVQEEKEEASSADAVA